MHLAHRSIRVLRGAIPRAARAFPLLALVAALPIASTRAQCSDPPLPPGGFALRADLGRSLSFLDGAQTRLDLRYPAIRPSPCGWPVLLYVHELGATRGDVATDCAILASEGYFVATWEVRGQGEWNALNPPAMGTQIIGRDERLDIAEVAGWLQSMFGSGPAPLADFGRLGFATRGPSGASLQGSAHAWAAAAWSGKNLPSNPRGLLRFPVFRAVSAALLPPVSSRYLVPQGQGFLPNALATAFLLPSIRLDPAVQAALQQAMLTEDFAAVAAHFDRDPFRQDLAELASSAVPVLACAGWDESWSPTASTLEALAALPPSTPRRSLLGVFGSEAPYNDREAWHFLGLQRRWFARFLKGEADAVELEAAVQSSVAPVDPGPYADPRTLLWTRSHDQWPPTATNAQRWYLRQNGVLDPAPPAGAEPADRIVHQVASGFDIAAYVTQAYLDVSATLQAIPLSSIAYDAAPFSNDVEIAGAARVRIEVTPSTANYQVYAALFDLAPNGVERFLAGGFALVRGGAPGPRSLDLVIRDTNVIVLAGHRLRLRVENLCYRRPPGQRSLEVAPYFESTAFQVEHGAARPSWLDLPVRDAIQPALSSSTHDISVLVPTDIRYQLEAPAALAGSGYVTLFSFSGTALTTPLPFSDPLRLTFDATTIAMLENGPPVIWRNPGQLDALGRQYPVIELRGLSGLHFLRGLRMSAAALVLQPSGLPLATNPIDVFFR